MLICAFLMIIGCQAPQRIVDDAQTLRLQEQALYEFNSEFLSRTKCKNSDELQKKLKLVMICKIAHQRAAQGLALLQEYVGSTEIISNAQLAATEENIKKIAEKVAEKIGEKE